MKKIIAFPHKPGSGGPGSFQKRFEIQLKKNGFDIGYLTDKNLKPDLIFVVGGTKKILTLLKWRVKNVPILYRLDGINWLHRKKNTRQNNLSNYFNSELRNILNKIIHGFLANYIIYQSNFVKKWWDAKGLNKRKRYSIIYNGVDLKKFNISKIGENSFKRLVIMEGLIDYSPYAVDLINELANDFEKELEVYGGIHYKSEKQKLNKKVNYKGKVGFDETPNVYANSIYISLDINPACPNTVVEALACGAPVVGFDTGAIKELVNNDCGRCVDYGSDPWNLEYPDSNGLIEAIFEVKKAYEKYSLSARKHAVQNFSIENITNKYVEIIKTQING